ncbi:MAG: hypothetical protein ACXWNJ_16990 [Vulcanimicrobiaceae bacterium]
MYIRGTGAGLGRSTNAERSIAVAAYTTTMMTSHLMAVNGSDFTRKAAINTAGMPPNANPNDARSA